MTDEMMTLKALLEKSADSDLLREMIGFTARRLMEMEIEGLTGASAGMAGASLSSRFGFASNGTYWSEHKGASGFAGSESTFSQRYDGRFTVISPTRISMTNRFNGQADTFSALFRAVKGGANWSSSTKNALATAIPWCA
jgi:hypothetical protein